MDGVYARAKDELNNPLSPYYLGATSSLQGLDNYLRGYNTNYFGGNAYQYLAPRQADSVEIYHKAHEARKKRNTWIGIGIAAIAAYIFRGKIPLIGKYLKKS